MAWHIPEGSENNHIDGRTHDHRIRLVNAVTGGQHDLILRLGCDSCPSCKRPYAKDSLGNLDPQAEIQSALQMLEANHAALLKYAQEKGIPIKVGALHSQVPAGHRLISSSSGKMLVRERAK